MKYSICLCTYKRPGLLRLLISDLLSQTLLPKGMIVVDGDPQSGDVLEVLSDFSRGDHPAFHYIPSNHANLAYQRYLGWRAAADLGAEYLLYLDDDLRIKNPQSIAKLYEPFSWDRWEIVGVTADTQDGDIGVLSTNDLLAERYRPGHQHRGGWIQRLGSARRYPPGGLTPYGQRIAPAPKESGFSEVQWLQGRVMFYRMTALKENSFSEDLFALDHIRCDLGEDTYLSRQAGARGKLLLGFGLGIEHPNADLPQCYPVEAYKFGYACAYSRRFLNDHYRVTRPPKQADRLALLKSYLGNALLAWARAMGGRKAYQFAYARGYSSGALRGLLQKPTAKALTPTIDWQRDAGQALQRRVILQPHPLETA